MLEQTCITDNEVCNFYHFHQGFENIETFGSRPRLFLQDQDQDQDYFKAKTIFHVLKMPQDQDQGLETTYLVASHDFLCGFRFDASDIALLLAVAGTHSPDLLLSLTENQLPKCGSSL